MSVVTVSGGSVADISVVSVGVQWLVETQTSSGTPSYKRLR